MGFKPDQPNNKKENLPNIHDNFTKLFDEAEVFDSYTNPKVFTNKPFDKMLYEEQFPGNIDYQIYGNDYKIQEGIGKFSFELYDKKNKKLLAQLMFSVRSDEDNKYLSMHHRKIDSKNIGVSGTDFIKKAEEYLQILKKNDVLLTSKVKCEVSQPNVLLWLEKNDFVFDKENTQNPEDFFKIEDHNIIPAEGYRFIKVLDSKNKILRDEYIIKEDFILDEDFQKKWKDYLDYKSIGGNIEPEAIFDLGEDNKMAGEVLDNVIKKGYVPRFYLTKEI